MPASRAQVVSSFTIIKGSLIEETYAIFRDWDFSLNRRQNLERAREANTIGASSSHWLRDVSKVLNRRFDPNERDRNLVMLAKGDCSRDVWTPILLWHMTRDEFLLKDFLVHWLFPQFVEGAYRLHAENVAPYLDALKKQKHVEMSGSWTPSTRDRVATGLLRMGVDFGLLQGSQHKEFASYHLPDESLLYLLHVLAAESPSARRIIDTDDWRMYLMDGSDVERELLRLHQYKRLHFEIAGSLARLTLPFDSPEAYVQELVA